MTLILEDQFTDGFHKLKILSREVALEQMSKAGNAVRESMRAKLVSHTTNYVTRVGKNGAYIAKSPSNRIFGQRESHTADGVASNPPNMANFITSFLMEKSETLVVGGSNIRFVPLYRKDGKVVGTGSPVGAVGPVSIAILHRMDTGIENSDYPTESKLVPTIKGRGFMKAGILAAKGRVDRYLSTEYFEVMERAEKKDPPETIVRELT